MRNIRNKNTAPELILRRLLYKLGTGTDCTAISSLDALTSCFKVVEKSSSCMVVFGASIQRAAKDGFLLLESNIGGLNFAETKRETLLTALN